MKYVAANPCNLFFRAQLAKCPGARTQMTSVKARKRNPRKLASVGRDFGHGASFAHRGYNIPR